MFSLYIPFLAAAYKFHNVCIKYSYICIYTCIKNYVQLTQLQFQKSVHFIVQRKEALLVYIKLIYIGMISINCKDISSFETSA